MTLECHKCGFKSPQGSEFCGSCGEDTEFCVEKMARNAALAAEAAEAVARGVLLMPCKTYFPNGRLFEKGFKKPDLAVRHDERPTHTHILDEEWDGPYESYYENGQLEWKGTCVAGYADGPSEEYYENGQLRFMCTIVAGKKDGPTETYHENGQLKEKGTYAADKRDGPYEDYYENGQLKSKGTCVAGEVDGPFESYYENGQLWVKCTLVAGVDEFHGPYESYDDDGQVSERGTFNMGQRCGVWQEPGWWEKWIWTTPKWFDGSKTKTYPPCPPGLEDGN